MSAFFLSQIFAGVTFILGLLAYQIKNRQVTLLLLGLAQVSASVHFFLLGATIGGFVVGISAIRFFTGIFSTHKIFKYLFLAATVLVGIVMFTKLYDILPIIGGVLGTLAAFCSVDKRMRKFLLGGTVSILIYNIFVFSPVAIFSGLFFIVSSLVGYWRFYIRKQSEQ